VAERERHQAEPDEAGGLGQGLGQGEFDRGAARQFQLEHGLRRVEEDGGGVVALDLDDTVEEHRCPGLQAETPGPTDRNPVHALGPRGEHRRGPHRAQHVEADAVREFADPADAAVGELRRRQQLAAGSE
jgi:hypothetical protein